MVQQQFFAKDLSFPVNKGRVLMGTSGNISKSFGVVGVLGEGKWNVERWENGSFTSSDCYLAGETQVPTTTGRREHIQKKMKEINQKLGYFYRKPQNLKLPIFPIPDGTRQWKYAQALADKLINSPKKAQKEKHLWTIGNTFLIGSLTSIPDFLIHLQSYLSKILTWPWNCITQNLLMSFHQTTKSVKILLYSHIKSYKIQILQNLDPNNLSYFSYCPPFTHIPALVKLRAAFPFIYLLLHTFLLEWPLASTRNV